ncbi:MAG: hypothetical protein ABJP45_07115, partial [Cyclobacteriaceae bacterium]
MKYTLPILLFTVLVSACQPPIDLLDVGIPLKMAEYRKQQVSDVVYNLSFDIPGEKEKAIPTVLNLSLKITDLQQP